MEYYGTSTQQPSKARVFGDRDDTVVSDPYCLRSPCCHVEKNVLQWELKVTGIEVTTRHYVDCSLWAAKLTLSWAMPHPLSKETAEAVIIQFIVRAIIIMFIISRRQIGLVRI